MAIDIVRGPAGAGKSQYVASRLGTAAVWIDFTRLFVALTGQERDPETGRFPVRHSGDGRIALTQAVKEYALREASRRGFSGFVTVSDSRSAVVRELQASGADGEVHTIVLPRGVLRSRLSDPVTGELSAECENALARWFR